MTRSTHLTACHECDLLLREIDLSAEKGTVACPRCDAELYRVGRNSLERSLALTCAALVLLVIATTFPIVGLNIQGHEIETTVFGAARQLWRDDMPGVAESAVVGVPHPDFGEVGVAVVIAKPGAKLDGDAILAQLKSQLANFKIPKRCFVATELPRNTMGKVQKNLLREQHKGLFA